LVPILVPAPGRLSMMTFWPSRVVRCWASSRATTSFGEPAVNGTIIRTGWLG
jgi:hypothetical protein